MDPNVWICIDTVKIRDARRLIVKTWVDNEEVALDYVNYESVVDLEEARISYIGYRTVVPRKGNGPLPYGGYAGTGRIIPDILHGPRQICPIHRHQ